MSVVYIRSLVHHQKNLTYFVHVKLNYLENIFVVYKNIGKVDRNFITRDKLMKWFP